MLGEKELNEYMKTEETVSEKKDVDVSSIFEAVNENLGRLIEAMADLGSVLNKTEKVDEVEEVKETETESVEEKEV